MTANQLSQKFLKWFQAEYPEARIYRNNAGIAKRGKQAVKFGIPNRGGADFIAFVPYEDFNCYEECSDFKSDFKTYCKTICKKFSNFLIVEFYEIKTAKDKMSKDQIKFADMITEMGGDYFIVKEIGDNPRNDLIDSFVGQGYLFFIEKWSTK
jgi:hypothetical protein